MASSATPLLCLVTAVALAGCATSPDTFEQDRDMMREALQGTGSQRPSLDPRSEPPQEPAPYAEAPSIDSWDSAIHSPFDARAHPGRRAWR